MVEMKNPPANRMIDSVSRILSQAYKNLNSLRRNTFRLSDVLVWPVLYLFTLTFFITYLGSDKSYLYMVILGMMGWRAMYFLNLEVVGSFTEEHWSKTLGYLFASPISRMEFAIGSAISGVLKSIFVIVIYLVLTYLLYGFVVLDWATFAIGVVFLAIAGFTLGLFALGLAYFMKEEAFNLSFILPDTLALLSGVYFAIDKVYPAWLLPFIRLLPTTQAFELLKSIVGLGHPDFVLLVLTSAGWLVIAYLFNGYMYDWARREGKLARLG
ncbi:ABC-2 type transporter [uncultured archaeon]|nr:ABC-2 type transporter [uncultured archaeon]